MRVMAFALLLGGCLIGNGQSVPVNAPTSSTQQASAEPEVICRSETPTGSLISREVCREKSDPLDALNQPTIQRMLEMPRSNDRRVR